MFKDSNSFVFSITIFSICLRASILRETPIISTPVPSLLSMNVVVISTHITEPSLQYCCHSYTLVFAELSPEKNFAKRTGISLNTISADSVTKASVMVAVIASSGVNPVKLITDGLTYVNFWVATSNTQITSIIFSAKSLYFFSF